MNTVPVQPRSIEVKNGELIIRVGVDVLPIAHEYYNTPTTEKFKITNPEGFAHDVAYELRHEKEDGTTLVCEMLDKAIERAIDNGSTHVEEV